MKILLYNERKNSYNHTKLNSTPVEQDVAPVGISVPTGTFRLNYGGYFTHIKFNFDGVDWICRITARRSLGDTLHEYDYAIDYLKDYYNKYGFFNQDIVIERSTDPNIWKKFIVDNQFPRGNKLSYTVKNFVGANWANVSVLMVIKYPSSFDSFQYENPGKSYYVLKAKDLPKLQKAFAETPNVKDYINQNTSANDLFSAIDGMYLIPSPDTSTGDFPASTDSYDTELVQHMEIYSKEAGDGGTYTKKTVNFNKPTDPNYVRILKIKKNSDLVISRPFTKEMLDSIFTHNDWRDYELNKYVAYVPFYGGIEINPQNFTGIYYHIVPDDGTVSISTNAGRYGDMHNAVLLPKASYVADVTSTAQNILNQQTAVNIGAASMQAVLSLGVTALGATMGNPVMIGGGVTSAVGSIGGAAISGGAAYGNRMAELTHKALTYSESSGSLGIYYHTIQIVKCSISQPLTMGEFASRKGYYCNYKITDSFPETTLATRCWLNLEGARIKGERWYAANVINELNGECVMIDR